MRWKLERIDGPRIRSGFLWLPKTIGDETRWLERATWVEEYDDEDDDIHGPGPDWYAVEWVDDTFVITDKGRELLRGSK